MNIEQLTEFFMWMTIINVGILILSSVLVMLLKDVLGKKHGKLFGIKEESVAVISYGYLGMYRIFVLVFNIVPYVALLIVG